MLLPILVAGIEQTFAAPGIEFVVVVNAGLE